MTARTVLLLWQKKGLAAEEGEPPPPLELEPEPEPFGSELPQGFATFSVSQHGHSATLVVFPSGIRVEQAGAASVSHAYGELRSWTDVCGAAVELDLGGGDVIHLTTSQSQQICRATVLWAEVRVSTTGQILPAAHEPVAASSPVTTVLHPGVQLKVKTAKRGMEVMLAADRSQKGTIRKKAGKRAQVDFGDRQAWVFFTQLEAVVTSAEKVAEAAEKVAEAAAAVAVDAEHNTGEEAAAASEEATAEVAAAATAAAVAVESDENELASLNELDDLLGVLEDLDDSDSEEKLEPARSRRSPRRRPMRQVAASSITVQGWTHHRQNRAKQLCLLV